MIELPIPPSVFATLVRAMLVGPLPPEKTTEEMRWEDDGGPLAPGREPWTHTFTIAETVTFS